jgi:hypothetical protein
VRMLRGNPNNPAQLSEVRTSSSAAAGKLSGQRMQAKSETSSCAVRSSPKAFGAAMTHKPDWLKDSSAAANRVNAPANRSVVSARVAAFITVAMVGVFMKKLAKIALRACFLVALLSGCASPGPSPEQQARDADKEREAQRQQAEFRKGLPPVANPGQGW